MIQMDISGNDCIHRIVVDYIDIDPDRSRQIIYCEKCFWTFHSIDRSIIKQENLQSHSTPPSSSSHE